MAKKSSSSNLSHLAQDRSTQSFKKKKSKLEKKALILFFLIKKCWFLPKLQGFEVERRKVIKKSAVPIPAICAFLCLFDIQLQSLKTFEGINIF